MIAYRVLFYIAVLAVAAVVLPADDLPQVSAVQAAPSQLQ